MLFIPFIQGHSQIGFLFFIDFVAFFSSSLFCVRQKRVLLKPKATKRGGEGGSRAHWNISFDWFYEVLLLYSLVLCVYAPYKFGGFSLWIVCVCQGKMDLKYMDAVYHQDNVHLKQQHQQRKALLEIGAKMPRKKRIWNNDNDDKTQTTRISPNK